ncbi:MAG: polysaccharide deacetylase family protein [Tyzzerella sp.]|nr:polysaccharide deacetylase family protein [Tyzzerella sp.]
MKIQSKKKIIIIALVALLICILSSIFTIWKLNKYHLELSISEKTITLEYGVDEMPEITALCKGTLINRKGTPVKTTMKGKLDLKKLGEYQVTFVSKYKDMTISEKRTIIITDTLPPEIQLVSSPDYYTNPSMAYVEEGFSATDNYDGDITSQVVSEEKDGIVTYTVSDSSGNTATAERKIIYKDVIAPVITLTNGPSISLNKGKDFVDPGFKAVDECDGDITSSVTVEGKVDGHTYGTYTLTYRVTDSSGNVGEVKRTVRIADLTAPVIALKGEQSTYIKVGTTYTDPGFTASDNIDGDMTAKVNVSGGVDTSKMGINTITYQVTDSFGNTSTVKRSIYVYQKQMIGNPINPGNKVVYLTFDDGPSRHTARLLNILDKYGVKATFFVTNQFPAYQYMIGETHKRGHTIALHTLTHRYEVLYKNEAAYYNDLEAIKNIVVNQTGVTPTIVRFPGGTSNTVSRKYCKGIMSSLVKSISYHGFLYCDWNVSSGDAGGAKTVSAISNNVINGIKKKNVSVVLQHDITSASVEAVEQILFWGIQNGYTFLPMSETTPMVHFKPQN